MVLTAFTAVRMLCFIELDIVPCKNRLSSQLTIWSGVHALITGVKSSLVPALICPNIALLLKLTRANAVLVLKIANSGPFSLVPGIGLSGGKKLNTLPEQALRQAASEVGKAVAIRDRMERPCDAHHHHHRFAQLAISRIGTGGRISATRFRIQHIEPAALPDDQGYFCVLLYSSARSLAASSPFLCLALIGLSPIRRNNTVRIQHIAQGNDAFQFMHIRTAHHGQDVELVCSHSLERQVQSLIGVDVRKIRLIHEIRQFLVSACCRFPLQHQNINDANESAPIRHQPRSRST